MAHGISSSSVACGSSQTRDQTRVPCIGRQILIHCTTRKVQIILKCIEIQLWARPVLNPRDTMVNKTETLPFGVPGLVTGDSH